MKTQEKTGIALGNGINLRVRGRQESKYTWKHNRSHRPLRAFTLIELLVVVAIIALLLAILVPTLQDARDLALRSVCSTNLHSIGVAMIGFAETNDGYPPVTREQKLDKSFVYLGWSEGTGWQGSTARRIVQPLNGYLNGNGKVWYCPADTRTANFEDHWPNLDGPGQFRQSYGYELWQRKLVDPPTGMFRHLGSYKLLVYDQSIRNPTPRHQFYPNHSDRGSEEYSTGQNQLWTDGSVIWENGWCIWDGASWEGDSGPYFTIEHDYYPPPHSYNGTGHWWG